MGLMTGLNGARAGTAVADEAVGCETWSPAHVRRTRDIPLRSAALRYASPKFRANREINREFGRFRLPSAISTSKYQKIQWLAVLNSLRNRTGN